MVPAKPVEWIELPVAVERLSVMLEQKRLRASADPEYFAYSLDQFRGMLRLIKEYGYLQGCIEAMLGKNRPDRDKIFDELVDGLRVTTSAARAKMLAGMADWLADPKPCADHMG